MKCRLATFFCTVTAASALVRNAPNARLSQESRRAFFGATMVGTAMLAGVTSSPLPATAASTSLKTNIPMLTTDEFLLVLRDSSRSIAQVDIFNNAQVIVRLLDGTAFGLSDVVESSTDPRSTLKIAALCREYKVPSKFVDIEAALLNTATTKRKNYANSRVQEANVREKERLGRMQKDEEQRLLELERLQQK
jgi:hypothetical protein